MHGRPVLDAILLMIHGVMGTLSRCDMTDAVTRNALQVTTRYASVVAWLLQLPEIGLFTHYYEAPT